MPRLHASFLIAILVTTTLAPQRVRSEQLGCPNVVQCRDGSRLVQTPATGDTRIDATGIHFFSYCLRKNSAEYSGGEVFGFSRDCRKVLHGQYDGETPLAHTYLWNNGRARRRVTFWKNGNTRSDTSSSEYGQLLDDKRFDEAGNSLPFPIGQGILQELPAVEIVTIKAVPTLEEIATTSRSFLSNEDYVLVCDSSPEVAFGKNAILDFFHKENYILAYVGTSTRALSIITTPRKVGTSQNVSFYHLTLTATDCNEDALCRIRVSVWKRTAPLEAGVVLLEKAVAENDAVTETIANLARNAVHSAVVKCRLSG